MLKCPLGSEKSQIKDQANQASAYEYVGSQETLADVAWTQQQAAAVPQQVYRNVALASPT